MKRQYKFDQNPEGLSPETIEKYRDFDGLYARYEEAVASSGVPVRRIWLSAVAGVAAALIGIFLLVGLPGERTGDYERRAVAYFAEQPCIDPPFSDIPAAEFAVNTVNADRGATLNFENGSRLIVPPAAFVDTEGAPVNGEVDIRYRELHDYVDFFLAGIPMQYDSAGQSYQLESAGMMEIYAEQEGRPVSIRAGKTIEVEMVSLVRTTSHEELPNYNVYTLDTLARNWNYQAVDEITILSSLPSRIDQRTSFAQLQNRYRQSLMEWEARRNERMEQLSAEFPLPPPPVKPEPPNPNAFVFELDLSELDREGSGHQVTDLTLEQLHEGTLWQVRGASQINSTELNQVWEDVQLQEEGPNVFLMTLIGADGNQLQVPVKPVVPGPSYDQALAQYEAEMTSYRALQERRAINLANRRDSMLQALETEKMAIWQQLEDARQTAAIDPADNWVEHQIINRFSVDRLGIWNCDRPLRHTGPLRPVAFELDNGASLPQKEAFLVNTRRNTIRSFYADEGAALPLQTNDPYLVWIVTEDQQLAVAKGVPPTSDADDSITFTFEVQYRALRSEEDVRAVLTL